MSGMFLFLCPAQLFRPALRLLRFGPLFQHLLAGSELFPPRQDPLFITPLSEPSQPVGRQHDRDIPDRLSRAVTPDLRPQIPLERQSSGSLFPATKKTGRFPAFRNTIKTSCLFFHPSRNELPSRGLSTSRKSLKRRGGETFYRKFPLPFPNKYYPATRSRACTRLRCPGTHRPQGPFPDNAAAARGLPFRRGGSTWRRAVPRRLRPDPRT